MTVTPLRGTEYAIDQVLTYLIEHLPAHVALVNVQHAGDDRGIQITAPPSADSYSVAELSWRALPPLPTIAILGDSVDISVDSRQLLMTRHPMTIVVVDMDANQDVLRRKMYRHTQAIVACLLDGMMTGAFRLYWQSSLSLARFSPVGILDNTYATDAQIYVEIELEETY